jgi:hypothetical protein
MSRTHKHIGKGLFNAGIEDENRFEIKKYLLHCKRYNNERSFFCQIKIKLINKIADKEMEEF